MSPLTRVLLIFVAVATAAAAVVAWQGVRFIRTPAGSDTATIVFELRSGQTAHEVSSRLEELGLITDARKFRAYARLMGRGGRVRVGEYALRKNMTPSEILRILASGKSIEYVVRVSEGLNRFEIAALIDRIGVGTGAEFLQLTADREFIQAVLGEDVPTLEGYLFPETYYVTRASGIKTLVRQMVGKFKEMYSQVQLGSALAVPLSKHQLVTLASIVEKETGAPEERTVISSVFHNRLRKGMRLQTDPTVIYGIWVQSGTWNRNISRKDLTTATPYNTYAISGLPPGPIANPGLEALRAAASPAKSEFLYFVSRNNGTHVFSREYSQHQNAVGEYQLDKRARAGKSWRDLKDRDKSPAVVQEATARASSGVKPKRKK